MGKMKVRSGCLSLNLNGRDHLEDPAVDGIILKLILRKWDIRVLAGFIWLRTEDSGGILGKLNERSN
jgi:hypothetical protein